MRKLLLYRFPAPLADGSFGRVVMNAVSLNSIRKLALALCILLLLTVSTQAQLLIDSDTTVTHETVTIQETVLDLSTFPAIRLTDDPAESKMPRAVVDENWLYVVWQDTRTGNLEIFWQKFTKNGTPVTGQLNISSTSGNSVIPAIGIDGSGNSYVIWQEGEPWGTIYGTVLDGNGIPITPPTVLSPNLCQNPDIDVMSDGTNWVVFHRRSASDQDVYIRSFDNQFVQLCQQRRNVGTLPAFDKTPAVTADASGRAFVVWRDMNMFWQDGIYFNALHSNCSIFINRVQASGAYVRPAIGFSGNFPWIAAELSNNVYNLYGTSSVCKINDVNGTARYPRVGDDADYGYVVWQDNRDGNPEIYLTQAYACNPFPDIRLTDDLASSEHPDIAIYTPKVGKWWVAWQDNRDGNWEIYLTGNSLEGIPNEPPVADVGGPHIGSGDQHIYFGGVGQPISFDGSGSYDPDGEIDVYEWQWFDGDSWHDEGSHPTHIYHNAGTHDVALRVTDDDGATDINHAQAIILDGWIFLPGSYQVLCPEGSEDICGGGCLPLSFDLVDGWGDAACNTQTGLVMASAKTINPEINAVAIHGGIFQVDEPTWVRAQVLMSSVGGVANLGIRVSGFRFDLVHCLVTDLQNNEFQVKCPYPSDIDPVIELEIFKLAITSVMLFFVPGWVGEFLDAVEILSFVEDYVALQQAMNKPSEHLEWDIHRTEPILLESGTHWFTAGMGAWATGGAGYGCAQRAGTIHYIFVERCDPSEIGNDLRITGLCPIQLLVTDPMGHTIDEETSSIPDAIYFKGDYNFDGDLDCSIHIPDALDGQYSITVVPLAGASSTNEFSLLVNYAGISWLLARDLEVSDIPEEPYNFWTIAVGSISGIVSDFLGGVFGVTVDLFDSIGTLIQSTHTDTSGFFEFNSVEAGHYTTSIVAPLGFVADFESRQVTVTMNADSVVNFELRRLEIIPSQKGLGYWKHQVNVHLSGIGRAQENLTDMLSYMNLISTHFNSNLTNPIVIFEVSQPATQTDSLEALQDLLTVSVGSNMNDRAKQQLIALMLNVVSLKLHQTTPISEDSTTVSQAITYCNQLITDSDPSNDEIAKDIADQINNGILVASGVVPLSTPNISYKGADGEITQTPNLPKQFSLSQNYPNPFNPVTEIRYALPEECHAKLTIYNILGQKVKDLVDEYQPAGYKTVKWDGKDNKGVNVATGVYFYRLETEEFTQTKKMLLLR